GMAAAVAAVTEGAGLIAWKMRVNRTFSHTGPARRYFQRPILAAGAGERVKLRGDRLSGDDPLSTAQPKPTRAGVSPFAALDMAPFYTNPGITERYNADPNPRKVNLGVGV